ncbi:PadR family transcriptional regulator [Nocardia vulneris]|uniref:PadR family transcriptional regulator n=1 Tax=Nocardia vulneris TaxID=1141657 RepID=UPI0006902659|nr:PadR family transcriptional regulator [Nocardia vulneris]
MALKHAVLAVLSRGDSSGYELSKAFEVGVTNFWHATPQQVYAELTKLEESGLISGRDVIGRGRQTKRVFTVTDSGRDELSAFVAVSSKPGAIREDLVVKVYASEFAEAEVLAAELEERAERSRAKMVVLDAILADLLGDDDEQTHLSTSEHPGRYLTAIRGRGFEAENYAWFRWAAAVLRARAAGEPVPARSDPQAMSRLVGDPGGVEPVGHPGR